MPGEGRRAMPCLRGQLRVAQYSDSAVSLWLYQELRRSNAVFRKAGDTDTLVEWLHMPNTCYVKEGWRIVPSAISISRGKS